MTTLFNYDPYFDDFDEDKNFMRVLFRPGYAVQARELTQAQTILANQIEKFGNHIFKSGSPITGGKISLDDRAYYIQLDTQYNGEDVVLENWLNKTIIGYNTTKIVRAKVIAIDNTTTNPILVVKYLSGEKFVEADEIKIYGQNIFAQAKALDAVGRSYVASIQEGIYYFKGQFVKVLPEFLVLETFYRLGYDTSTINVLPSYKIGIEFDQEIYDEIDDSSLLDPAQGSFNYQAPGATRSKLITRLSKRTLDSADESAFFEVVRVVDGVKTKEVQYPIYSEIEKTLARRTYDESGNYTVDPFVLTLEEEYANRANNNYADPNYFSVILDPGKAYVAGHEFQTIAPTKLGVYRGRATANVSDYDIPTNYSSYVVVENVQGTTNLDITTFPTLDIHCVPKQYIDKSGTTYYNSTKIGTVRVNNMKYHGATSTTLGTSHTHRLNLFEANTTPIIGNLASSGHSSANVILPTAWCTTLQANSYQGMYFHITDGAGRDLAPIRIESSGSNFIRLDSSLSFTPAANAFTIESGFSGAESLVIRSGGALLWGADVNVESRDSTGDAYITEKNKDSLLFPIPFEALKEGTITNFDFFANKVYSNKLSDGGGVITISTVGTDTFAFAGSGGTLGDTAILENIVCLVRSDTSATNSASGIAGNTILSLANNLFTVVAVDSTTIQVDLNTPAVRCDFIIKTKVNQAEDGTNGAVRTKSLYPANDYFHTRVPYILDDVDALNVGNTGTVTAITGGYVFPTIGVTHYDFSSVGGSFPLNKLKTPGVPVSLQVADVYEIVKIIDSKTNTGNITMSMLTNPAHDVTDHYELDNGHRKTHYDHATIRLKRGYSSPTGSSLMIQYKYFNHGSAPSPQNNGLFTVDSYTGSTNLTYNQLPKFFNREDGRIVSARAALDFRPTRDVASTTLTGAVNPDPDSLAELSFEYYLPRIDQVVVKPSQEISIISGKPAVIPVAPPVGPEDLHLYTMYVPAYTESVKDIRADFKNNKRYTMKDISSFDTRIRGLEYYVSLNTLEKNANDSKILDATGLERSKYGILVDNFGDNGVQATYGDAGFDNRCMVDNGLLKPAALMRTVKMLWNEAASSGSYRAIGSGDKRSLMMDYTSLPFAQQDSATKSVGVASALYGAFRGNMKLFPEYTAEADTDSTAKVTLNSMQGIENPFNFINDAFRFLSDSNPGWVNDANNPFAKVIDSKWFENASETSDTKVTSGGIGYDLKGADFGNLQTTTNSVYIKSGAQYTLQQIAKPTASTVDVGTYVTDVSINPYLKPKAISFVCNSLRPDSNYFAFFDGVSVNNYVVVPNRITTTISLSTNGFQPGEIAVIANNQGETATFITNYKARSGTYKTVRIVNADVGRNVSLVNESGQSLQGKYLRGVNSDSLRYIETLEEHKSGVTRSVGATTITLASDAPSFNIAASANTNVLYLVRSIGTDSDEKAGILENATSGATVSGATFNVIAYDTTTKIATIQQTTSATQRSLNWTYSLGSNKSTSTGDVGGVLYPPKATFRTGERVLRITESFNNTYDKDAISFTETSYVSSGVALKKTNLIDTVYNFATSSKFTGETTSKVLSSQTTSSVLTSTGYNPPPAAENPTPAAVVDQAVVTNVISTAVDDPLAQTFYVDPEKYPLGLFAESIDLFFSAKDDTLPVTVQIRPTVNGAPSADFWYQESVSTKYPSQVNVSSTPSVDVASTATKFTFPSPVFLKPGLYAAVILSSSPDYLMWVAEKGALTTANKTVSQNPYVGTLYKSQNSMEYVPFLNEDLMFTLNRCKFVTGTSAYFSLDSEKPPKTYYIDKFRLLETSIKPASDFPVASNYYFVSTPINGAKETQYRSLIPQMKYDCGLDSKYTLGSRRKELVDKGDFTVKYQISTNTDTISPIVSLESLHLNVWENFIDNAEINAEDFNIISPGAGYANSNTIVINSSTGEGATVFMSCDGVKGNVLSMNVSSTGFGYLDDFTISYPNANTTANVTSNASIVLNSEFDSTAGPCLAKYITKPVVLADGFDAGDIRVYLAVNRPSGTDVTVFYKLLSSSDSTAFKDRRYQKMECFNPTTSISVTNSDFFEFEFRPSLTSDEAKYTSDSGVTYDTFKTFSVKIVMTSSDPSVVPSVKDLRIIALPAG